MLLFQQMFIIYLMHLIPREKKKFRSKFGIIEKCLKTMVHSYSATQYHNAFVEAKALVKGDVEALENLYKIDQNKHMFSKYLVKDITGNLNRSGSTPAEQNHSSYVARIGPRSIENIPNKKKATLSLVVKVRHTVLPFLHRMSPAACIWAMVSTIPSWTL